MAAKNKQQEQGGGSSSASRRGSSDSLRMGDLLGGGGDSPESRSPAGRKKEEEGSSPGPPGKSVSTPSATKVPDRSDSFARKSKMNMASVRRTVSNAVFRRTSLAAEKDEEEDDAKEVVQFLPKWK